MLKDHDPLCPMFVAEDDEPDDAYCCLDCDGYGCECWIIAKVRADERAKRIGEDQWISAREAREYEADIRADEREQAAQRVEALKPDRVYTAGGIGYCDALRDAAAAARGEE